VFPHTYQTVDFMPRLAQAAGAALVPEATGFAPAADGGGLEWTRPALAGKLQARVRLRGAAGAAAGAGPGGGVPGRARAARREAGSAAPETSTLAWAGPAAGADREVLGYEQVAAQQVDLTKADIIVAVGRGIGGADKMAAAEELARALGAEIGASRPVIDSGW